MTYTPDLDAYLKRIGHAGPRAPTLDTLDAILFAHIRTIPFENIDVLWGRGIDLDPHAVERKLVHERRGGYCFEQNSLLLHVLGALGYTVTPLSARVRLNRPRDFVPPRTHLFLRVDLPEGRYLADVGVGAMSPTCALRLDTGAEQETPHEPRRLVREGAWGESDLRGPEARLFHQVRLGDRWEDVCELTLEPMPEIDREVSNWFTSTHPKSHFRDHLMVARATPTGRITLLDRELTERSHTGQADKRMLRSRDQLLSVLESHFGITLGCDANIDHPAFAHGDL